ncbi:NAD(P)H-dependent oxidoreductase [Priestia megaterium]|jgi:azobenzene reductase|uniref:FMN-dependent NADPH-azoreductase n=1 Tax=Priestia megaterium (strain ATCC 14581 / DSM 32 / CCUG 1817 / JCM 2506 / NBRC 15308 / NCIMB 9376 / NCTC 10342 / NRRL B-14308 / VKM B-512 / Ford 19) TaxID=1348623 RepID=A0A0B6AQA5_PRIM2|nr:MULTISPECIES: NADPH-dependent FMN reductase [Priestia]AJI23312.1 FMN-dependent NADPH-azoreductase [Priestia megaterium NBRC 15308 = ATCC 14581]KFM97687.1 FMN-dependent NADPH-azoreductase [Priestia megaterium]KGJ84908.1 FMN-dependent NADH-azoreductase [Priestia megaterium NBRC 15308 = ATCC 14581]MBX9994586.1 NAD(P)H-dependent oxidoreductase [Priestia aryabhattai]MBY0201295.1 NAD(P)H-dependent oxidoreductase [Priestia megaterium]
MNILIINGSPRETGRTTQVTREIHKSYQSSFLDLSQLSLPIFTGEPHQYETEEVQELIKKIEKGDGILLATPEYHGAMSGALKNAFDFLNSAYFAHKPVALLAVSGGGKGGINALNNLRTVTRALYANVLSKQLVLDPADILEKGTLRKNAADGIHELVNELTMYTQVSKQILEAKQNV